MPKIAAARSATKIGAGLLASALVFAPMSEAHADGVAFWGYWQAKGGTWAFASTGPAQAHPKDGAVEGWRFAKSSGNTGTPPRDKPDFAAICGPGSGTPAGKKRVAVVIDYGEAGDAPKGQVPRASKRYCATVPENATGSDVLAAAGSPQADKSGLICAIDSFGTCGIPIAPSPTATAASKTTAAKKKDSGTPVGLYAGIGLIVVVAAGGGLVAVRRSRR
ncbi:SCO2322 family protein [Actinoallomurus rhizosphaericola]|uniref:SCO2322 family protein n=1 Tax=Actinoallomurus rhizosphaericola TaxID=2952536 RepID=UPI0020935F41|nr:SCO2322 family protein [Actinoallomurus rhizosphaericola]MCO5996473.1 SCO2322 family protein [Actinoallomurus rhizosphaericola]